MKVTKVAGIATAIVVGLAASVFAADSTGNSKTAKSDSNRTNNDNAVPVCVMDHGTNTVNCPYHTQVTSDKTRMCQHATHDKDTVCKYNNADRGQHCSHWTRWMPGHRGRCGYAGNNVQSNADMNNRGMWNNDCCR